MLPIRLGHVYKEEMAFLLNTSLVNYHFREWAGYFYRRKSLSVSTRISMSRLQAGTQVLFKRIELLLFIMSLRFPLCLCCCVPLAYAGACPYVRRALKVQFYLTRLILIQRLSKSLVRLFLFSKSFSNLQFSLQ